MGGLAGLAALLVMGALPRVKSVADQPPGMLAMGEATNARLPTAPSQPAADAGGKVPRAVARYEGVATPGLPVTLKSDESAGSDLRVHWVQTEGPRVALDNASSSTAQFTVPEGSGTLGFLLVVSDSRGMDSARLTIPIVARSPGRPEPSVRADAGDDQVGLV